MQRKFFLSLLVFLGATVSALAQISFSVSYKRVSPTEIDVVFTGNMAAAVRPPRVGTSTARTSKMVALPVPLSVPTNSKEFVSKAALKKAPVSRRSTMRFLICP